jgi:hypothetical protein
MVLCDRLYGRLRHNLLNCIIIVACPGLIGVGESSLVAQVLTSAHADSGGDHGPNNPISGPTLVPLLSPPCPLDPDQATLSIYLTHC